MHQRPLEILLLGTGTSAGVPMIGCDCPVCRSDDPRDRRGRCSAVISYDQTRVLIDTTPELRLQCVQNRISRIDAVVYTHAHADHIMGLDDVRRFNAVGGRPLDVHADPVTLDTLQKCFGYAFVEPDPNSKLHRPHLIPRPVQGPFQIAGRTWTPIPMNHGQVNVLGYRVGELAYCTDCSNIPDASFDLLDGVRVLIIDALQWKKHATHFTIDEAIDASRRIGARETWFTHLSHQIPHAQTDAMLPRGMRLAYDGLRVVVG